MTTEDVFAANDSAGKSNTANISGKINFCKIFILSHNYFNLCGFSNAIMPFNYKKLSFKRLCMHKWAGRAGTLSTIGLRKGRGGGGSSPSSARAESNRRKVHASLVWHDIRTLRGCLGILYV